MPVVLPEPLRQQRRRLRIRYGVVVGALLLAAGLTMGLVIGTGEAAHATLTTSAAAGAVPQGTVRSTPSVVWSTTDRPAQGDPLWVGTVVTSSQHQLSGRDAVTGAVRWSYRRTDLSVCDAAQQNGRAYVLFRRDGNCDELSTFDAGTGARGWFRTLADDGDGRLGFGGTGLLVTYARSFHAIDPESGVERFASATQPGDCAITSAVPGDDGIAVTQQCGDGAHLALYTNFGASGQAVTKYRVPVDASVRAVAAGTAVTTYDPATATITQRTLDTGDATASPALSPTPAGEPGPTTAIAGGVVLQLGARLYSLLGDVAPGWTLGDVVGPGEPVDRNGTTVLAATTTGASRVDATTGLVTATYRFGPPTDGARVYDAGAGLIVAGAGLAYLR